MKFIFLFVFLSLFSGCSKVSNITSATGTDTEQTGDPVYDSQSEVRVLVPWSLVL